MLLKVAQARFQFKKLYMNHVILLIQYVAIQLKLEKSGNYVFMAVNGEGETVDVTFTIRAEKSADGGVILLK